MKDVEGNYGLQLQQDFKRIFSADNKGNSEVIMAVSYMEGEAENSLSRGYTYSLVSGTTNKDSFRENGTPWDDALDIQNNGQQKYEYKLSLYNSFEKGDTRCDASLCLHIGKKEVENCMYMVLMYVKFGLSQCSGKIESMMVILFFTVYPGYI